MRGHEAVVLRGEDPRAVRRAARLGEGDLVQLDPDHPGWLYWYTLEFGVCQERGALKAYGAGLLSSFGELGAFEERARLLPFDPALIAETPYDPTDYQRVLFVATSFGEMVERVRAFLEALP